VTFNTEVPVEEEVLKMSLVPALPWRLKVTVELVAFTPATVPLSWKIPVARVEAEVNLATRPFDPPLTLAGAVVAIIFPVVSAAKKVLVTPVK
jgi:hypothetical protein